MATESCVIKLIIGVLILACLLVAIIVPISYGHLEYYEYGFVRQRSTGKVDTSRVYVGGKYFLGPDYEFKIFRADAHTVKLKDITVFTADSQEVHISVYFQYFLKKGDLSLFHASFGEFYRDAMINKGIDAIQTVLPELHLDKLLHNRSEVETHLFKSIRQRLEGVCCNRHCNQEPQGCLPGCKASNCSEEDKGAFVNVRYFQLTDIEISKVVGSLWMEELLKNELELIAEYKQEAQIIRKINERQVAVIKNTAEEIIQEAYAQSRAIRTASGAEYLNMIETARCKGLNYVFTDNMNQTHKNSFDYLRTLQGLDNIHLTVDFQQRIAGRM